MMRVYKNRYAGKCQFCGVAVGENQGFAYAEQGRRFKTVCNSSACISDAPAEVQAKANEVPRREITDAGEIFMPYEADALPILRGMPNARFNRDKKCWTVSVEMKDRARVVDACKRLNLDMPDGFDYVKMDTTHLAAVKRAMMGGAYGYQQVGVRFLAQHDRALLGDDMGLGKTFQSIMAIEGRAIVLCPATLKTNWSNEVRKWRKDLNPIVCQGRDGFQLPADGDVVILNYEILPKEFDPTDKYGNEHNVPELWGKVFSKTTLIADEAHLCKSHKATRSKRTKVLASLCKNTWALTGTPLLSKGFDLWGVLSTFGMARDVFGGWKGFIRSMNGQQDRFGGWYFTPDASVPERLRRVMLRRMKTEVLTDLPPKQTQTITVDLSAGLTRRVNKAWKILQEADMSELPSFQSFSKVRAALAKDRISALTELVESCEDANEPVVVFSAHRAPIEALAGRDGWAVIMGNTSQSERQRAVDAFQAGDLKGIACTIKAGGTGITLTHASKMIFCDLEWNPALNLQAEDRICRIGQTASNLQYIRLVSDHPMDLHVLNLLDEKTALINGAVENECAALTSHDKGTANVIVQETREQRDARIAAVAKKLAASKAKSKVSKNKASWTSRINGFSKTAVSPEIATEIANAVTHMQSICDGARSEDGAGFNKPDAAIMHIITESNLLSGDDELLRFCWWTLRKYKRQLHTTHPKLYGAV